jgi:hypothetical protein
MVVQWWKSTNDFHRLLIDFHNVNRRESQFQEFSSKMLRAMNPVYLDYNSSTPMDPRVFRGDAALPSDGGWKCRQPDARL